MILNKIFSQRIKVNLTIILPATLLIGLTATSVFASEGKMHERDYQVPFCQALGGQTEVRVPGGRIDCVTRTHTIEVDWAKKRYQCHGQASRYVHVFGRRRKPGCALIVKSVKDLKYVKQLLHDIRSDRRKWAVWAVWEFDGKIKFQKVKLKRR